MRRCWSQVGTVWFLLAGFAIAACGSSGPSAPATASAACEQLFAAAAKRDVKCEGGAVADWLAFSEVVNKCSAYDGHVAAGEVEYRPAGFAACLAQYDHPCDESVSCLYEVLHGLVPDGQPCWDDEMCGTTSACVNLTGIACGGQCMQIARENQTCGLYCGTATPCYTGPICATGLACLDNVCAHGGEAGAVCGGPQQLGCTWPAICNADPTVTDSFGVCTVPVAGGPCHADGECLLTQFCLAGACAPRRALGASCADGPTGCVPFTACDAATSVCVSAGRLGQPCAAPYPSVPSYKACVTGVCDLTTSVCIAGAGAGESCVAGPCAPGAECDIPSTTCMMCGA